MQLLTFLVSWCSEDAEDFGFERKERFEAVREAFRSILGQCGVHRSTAIFAEAWQLLTSVRILGEKSPEEAVQIPISSAAPAPMKHDLVLIGYLPHASILEEEICSALDLCEDLISKAETEHNPMVGEWLQDLRFATALAHFVLLHRSNRDA